MADGVAEEVTIIAKHVVRPSSSRNGGVHGVERIHLTPWDLRFLTIHHVQKGLLFPKPQHKSIHLVISDLLTSFSHAIDHFYPLAGRLHTTKHPDDNSVSISLDCTNEGAEFVHASALHVTTSDILASHYYIPPVVHSFFPLNGDIAYDGHTRPLFGVQVTELADGIFVAGSLNHSVGEGTAFWYIFKTWSTISRTGEKPEPQVFDRWFPDSRPPPMRIPFTEIHRHFAPETQKPMPRLPECALEFPSAKVKELKARANQEMAGSNVTISSLQAVLAHVWRSVSRARALKPEEETVYILAAGYRSRLSPPLPESYIGNSLMSSPVKAVAGEIESKGLGWMAWLLNQAAASHRNDAAVYDLFQSWSNMSGSFSSRHWKGAARPLFTSGSPRFDVYGNDFGWGRPVAARSGPAIKVDGMLTVYPGAEDGGIAMEICLPAEVLNSLLADEVFMDAVA